MSDQGRCTPERKVLGELSNVKEPISPTANLRLLTSLASNLKSAGEVSQQGGSQRRDSPVPSGSGGSKLLPRKQKSLGLLCNKFLNMYPLNMEHGAPKEISLDGTARALGTEKRRIYDIINVLESLEMAAKAGKNRYLWHGQSALIGTLTRLKSTAIRIGMREQIQEIQRINKAYTGEQCDASPGISDLTMSFEETAEEESLGDCAIKEDKSLGAMCQKFVMLFLISMKNGVINLDIAAKVLIGDVDDQTPEITDNASRSRSKTKVRRLYDIANVLTAIGLIKKVHMDERTIRKPVFKYVGPDVEVADTDTETPTREIRHHTPIGMSTPNKSGGSAPLQGLSLNTLSNTRCKTFIGDTDKTPITDKRKPRKRKLFDTDSSFPRTHSTPNFEKKSRSLERLDDSILRVAEMELERLNSSEESKPKVCTKLFPRYNSDSCISAATAPIMVQQLQSPGTSLVNPQLQVTNVPLIIVSKENVVGSTAEEIPQKSTASTSKLQAPTKRIITPTAKRLESKILIQNTTPKSIVKLVPLTSVPKFRTIQPTIPSEKTSQPKVINLSSFDPKKLISIKRSDIKLSLAPVTPVVLENYSNNNNTSSFAIITTIKAPIVSPGDTFEAVKIGDTLQLVPMRKNNTDKANHGTFNASS
ncbi:transcription factor E2F8 [Diachasma alloeum]|uniref:transcription factor E2F8 n=1 Tax=Diachasma alloeum TaxID=454923 RepID=UPI0007382EE9|nr:transcription factor E2F8 [Diachasma alloeum]